MKRCCISTCRKYLPPNPKRGQPVARVLDKYLYPDDLNGKAPEKDNAAKEQLQSFILMPLFERLVAEEKLTASFEEIKTVREYLETNDDDKVKKNTNEPDARYRRLVAILTTLPVPVLFALPFDKLPEDIRKRLGVDTAVLLHPVLRDSNLLAQKFSESIYAEMVKQWKINRVLYKRYAGTVIFQQSDPTEPVGAYRKYLEQMEREIAFEVFDKDARTAFFDYFVRKDHPMQLDPKEIDFETLWWTKPKDKE